MEGNKQEMFLGESFVQELSQFLLVSLFQTSGRGGGSIATHVFLEKKEEG